MTDSDRAQNPPPKYVPNPEVVKHIASALNADLKTGNLGHSRMVLRMAAPEAGRAALVALGPAYAELLKNSNHLKLDKLEGRAAANAFIRDELRPLVVREMRKPLPAPKKSIMRRLVRGAASVALAVGLAMPATVQNTSPAFSLDSLIPPTSTATTAASTIISDPAALQPLRDEFAKTSLGRDMLAMAEYHKIAIVYDTSLVGSGTAGTYNFGDKTVRMSPGENMASQVMFLAHELRHAWQDIALEYGEMERRLLTPTQQWTLRRYLEADAFAFSAYFMAERLEELPKADVPGGQREMAAARLLHAEFSSPDGLTNDEYRRHALDRMFQILGGYSENHLTLAGYANDEMRNRTGDAMQQIQRDELREAAGTLGNLQVRMNSTPSKEAFDEYLRRFGGFSLSPEAPTALQPAAGTHVAHGGHTHDGAQTAASAETPVMPNSSDAEYQARLEAAEALHQSYRAIAKEMMQLNQTRMDIAAEREAQRRAKERQQQEKQATPPIQSRFTAPESGGTGGTGSAPETGIPPTTTAPEQSARPAPRPAQPTMPKL